MKEEDFEGEERIRWESDRRKIGGEQRDLFKNFSGIRKGTQ